MRGLKKVFKKIAERPRLVLAIMMLAAAIMLALLLMGYDEISPVIITNCVFGWTAIVVWFALCMKVNDYRMATLALLVIVPVMLVTLGLCAREYMSISLFVLPTVALGGICLDRKRWDSRKNIMILAALLIVMTICVAVGVLGGVNFSVGPIVVAVALMLFVWGIRIVARFSGVHFDFGKYFLPKDIKKVSVVIPNYNYARYMRERVSSILRQNYPIYELIILDDKSTDDSVKVIKEIMAELKRKKPELKVKFIPNEENSGNVFRQWQKCFTESSGDFVWICEADDSCSKYFLNAVMKAFEDEGVVLSYAESCTIDEKGKKQKSDLRDWIDMFETGHWRHSYVLDGKEELEQVLCVNNTIANVSSVVFRKEKEFIKYLKKAQEFTLAGDWYFYSKVLLNGKIAYHDESLNYHRMHSKGVTLTTDNHTHYDEIIAVQDSIAGDVKLGGEAKKKVEKRRRELERTFGFSKDEMRYRGILLKELLKKNKIKDETLLTVIVCAYNADKYIRSCLKSVENSLPEKSEIIVVDDGSTDGTAKMVKEMARDDGRIRYYRKNNGGLSSAKNFGLTKAQGRYVIFMDADDEINGRGYEVMLKKAVENDADIVVCDMELVYDNKTNYCSVYHYGYKNKMMGFLVDGLMASSNNKMVKRNLLHGIKYPEGKNNEDVAVTPVLFALAKNIQYIPSAFYKYYQRKGSIQNSEFNKKRLVIFDTCKQAIWDIEKVAPEKVDLVKGVLVSNQLTAVLVYIICDMKDAKKRDGIIAEFCKRYKEMDVAGDKYVKEYNQMIGLPDLEEYVLNRSPRQIYRYVRRQKNREVFNGYMRKLLNRK